MLINLNINKYIYFQENPKTHNITSIFMEIKLNILNLSIMKVLHIA